jgi:hypothetical protein
VDCVSLRHQAAANNHSESQPKRGADVLGRTWERFLEPKTDKNNIMPGFWMGSQVTGPKMSSVFGCKVNDTQMNGGGYILRDNFQCKDYSIASWLVYGEARNDLGRACRLPVSRCKRIW